MYTNIPDKRQIGSPRYSNRVIENNFLIRHCHCLYRVLLHHVLWISSLQSNWSGFVDGLQELANENNQKWNPAKCVLPRGNIFLTFEYHESTDLAPSLWTFIRKQLLKALIAS